MAIWEFFERRKLRKGNMCESFDQIVDDAEYPKLCNTSTFLDSALRAAKSTNASHRRVILTDVAGLLSCGAEDLDFLFDCPVIAANDTDPVMMPDYRLHLKNDRRVAAI